jgi:hypothetical protein
VDANLSLLHGLRHMGYGGAVALTAHTEADGIRLEDTDADVVLRPFVDAGTHVDEMIDGPVD